MRNKKYFFHLGVERIKKQVPKATLLLLALFGAFFTAPAKVQDLGEFSTLRPLAPGQWQDLRKDEVVASSQIQTVAGQQSLSYYAAGLHPLSCTKALRKMSQYESYKDFISFITHSRYDERAQKIFLRFNHALLPFPLTLHFTIPRIAGPGVYPFFFDKGMLTGLRGKIQVSPHGDRCLMEVTSDWRGRPTGINDLVFEIFSVTLGKLGIKKVFRISSL